jgi:hypothetical protein
MAKYIYIYIYIYRIKKELYRYTRKPPKDGSKNHQKESSPGQYPRSHSKKPQKSRKSQQRQGKKNQTPAPAKTAGAPNQGTHPKANQEGGDRSPPQPPSEPRQNTTKTLPIPA